MLSKSITPPPKFQTGGGRMEMGAPDRCIGPGSAFYLYCTDFSDTLSNRHSWVEEIQVFETQHHAHAYADFFKG